MKNILLSTIGTICVVLGAMGIILPLLPTTPFLLLALGCFLKSNRKFYNYILANNYLGPYVRDYICGKGIPVKVKKRAILLIWLTIGFSVFFIIDKSNLKYMLLLIASVVSIYIWTRGEYISIDSPS